MSGTGRVHAYNWLTAGGQGPDQHGMAGGCVGCMREEAGKVARICVYRAGEVRGVARVAARLMEAGGWDVHAHRLSMHQSNSTGRQGFSRICHTHYLETRELETDET